MRKINILGTNIVKSQIFESSKTENQYILGMQIKLSPKLNFRTKNYVFAQCACYSSVLHFCQLFCQIPSGHSDSHLSNSLEWHERGAGLPKKLNSAHLLFSRMVTFQFFMKIFENSHCHTDLIKTSIFQK